MRPIPFLIAVLAGSVLQAQMPPLRLPEASPRAQIIQQVGLTELSVSYHRPAVGSRPVWGQLVPYGEVWRAGANENTVLAFSTPVTVGGKLLPAGRYGLHMIPASTEWTVILSTQAGAWGSYSYDPKEDAVRFKVAPAPGDFVERLSFGFDDPTDRAVTLTLAWEKLRVPLRLEVDTPKEVVASLREQLRGLPRFYPEGWLGAAAWCVKNGVNQDEALAWVDRSLALRETFGGLRTKAAILEKKGDAAAAEKLRARAMPLATEGDLNQLGYALLAQKKVDEATAVFQKNVQAHPASWNVYDSLAEALAIQGKKAEAAENYRKARELVRQPEQVTRIEAELKKLK